MQQKIAKWQNGEEQEQIEVKRLISNLNPNLMSHSLLSSNRAPTKFLIVCIEDKQGNAIKFELGEVRFARAIAVHT